MLGECVQDATAKRVTLELHPFASPLRITVLPDGDLEVTGETSAVGPGYHAYAIAQLAPMFDAAIARVLDSGTLILGPEVQRFEQQFATWLGGGHAVGVNSGTDATRTA